MAQEFGQRPSAIARELYGDALPPYVTARDWYAFDVAATVYLLESRLKARREELDRMRGRRAASRTPHGRRTRAAPVTPDYADLPARADDGLVVRSNGQNLHIRGTEVPPWER